MTSLLAIGLWLYAAASNDAVPNARLELLSLETRRTPAVSADRRFEMQASARLETPVQDDARFQLKAVLVDCSPTPPDLLFANGYENE